MMYDFRDVHAASKKEQIRAYAIEQAIEADRDSTMSTNQLVNAAAAIEKYILDGNPTLNSQDWDLPTKDGESGG